MENINKDSKFISSLYDQHQFDDFLYKQNLLNEVGVNDAALINKIVFDDDWDVQICDFFQVKIKKEFHEGQFSKKVYNIFTNMEQNQHNYFKEFKTYCSFLGQKIIDNNIVNTSRNIQNQIIQLIYYYKVKSNTKKKKKIYQCIQCIR